MTPVTRETVVPVAIEPIARVRLVFSVSLIEHLEAGIAS